MSCSTRIYFRVLGPLEIRSGNRQVKVNARRMQIILAMLLLEPGRVIVRARLVDAVWGDNPPATTRAQIQICMSGLRRRLATMGAPGDIIATHPAGYAITVPDDAVDLLRFRRMVALGREAALRRDALAAVAHLRGALRLWRGDAASGLESRVVRAVAVGLQEERLSVLEECIGMELALGHHHRLIRELRELIARCPLWEQAHGWLVVALYRSGRRAEALAAYRNVRRILVNEHGIEPGKDLRSLERAILADDPTVGVPSSPLSLARS
jgi:DNA-binding SARP family transcriptional activator